MLQKTLALEFLKKQKLGLIRSSGQVLDVRSVAQITKIWLNNTKKLGENEGKSPIQIPKITY